jgi:hypothetical protein
MRSRRHHAQIRLGRNVSRSRSVKDAPPSDALVNGGTRADRLSAHPFPFFFINFFFFGSLVILCIALRAIPSCTFPLASTHTNPLSTPRPLPSLTSCFLFALSLLTPHPCDDNGPEICSSPLFSVHLPPSASIGPPSRACPANPHPRPALVIKASSSYTASLSATTSEP